MTVKVVTNQRPQRSGRGQTITYSAEHLYALTRAADAGSAQGTKSMNERERAYQLTRG